MFLDPDLDTFGIIPWERSDAGSTAKVICDVYAPDGESFAGDPRGVLRRQLKRAEDKGLRYMTGPELEFFMLPHSAVEGFNGSSTNGNGNGGHQVGLLPPHNTRYLDPAPPEASHGPL